MKVIELNTFGLDCSDWCKCVARSSPIKRKSIFSAITQFKYIAKSQADKLCLIVLDFISFFICYENALPPLSIAYEFKRLNYTIRAMFIEIVGWVFDFEPFLVDAFLLFSADVWPSMYWRPNFVNTNKFLHGSAQIIEIPPFQVENVWCTLACAMAVFKLVIPQRINKRVFTVLVNKRFMCDKFSINWIKSLTKKCGISVFWDDVQNNAHVHTHKNLGVFFSKNKEKQIMFRLSRLSPSFE